MDDSEQVLDLFPNHRGFSYRSDFGGQKTLPRTLPVEEEPLLRGHPKLLGIACPATHGLRTSTKTNQV
jgi:hypothetical protein